MVTLIAYYICWIVFVIFALKSIVTTINLANVTLDYVRPRNPHEIHCGMEVLGIYFGAVLLFFLSQITLISFGAAKALGENL